MTKEDTQGAGPEQSGAAQARANFAKTKDAESNARAEAARLRAQGDAIAKKHGG